MRDVVAHVVMWCVRIFFAVILAFPFYWMLITTFKRNTDLNNLKNNPFIYNLTRGGPYDTTQVIPSEAFFTGILGSDLAEGAAISIFLVPLLVIVAYFMLRQAHRAEVT